VYPQLREVFDSEHWTGWTRMPAATGSVDNRWTFRNVEPEAGVTTEESGAKGVVIAVVIAVVIVVGVVVWLLVRRRRGAKLEVD